MRNLLLMFKLIKKIESEKKMLLRVFFLVLLANFYKPRPRIYAGFSLSEANRYNADNYAQR